MLMKRFGIVGNPHTGYPDGVYAKSVGLGWLRALVLDSGSWEAMCDQMPATTNVAAVITGQSGPLNNDFWSDGWRERFTTYITEFCERFYKKVRLIEFTNEWDFWDNTDRAEKAAEVAMIGTQICKQYGILGVLGSVASSDWKNQLATACSVIDRAEAALGYKAVHGFAFHPYMSRVQRDGGNGFTVPDAGWERLRDKVREAIDIAGGRPIALTELGIKVGDAGGVAEQALYVHGAFQDELAAFGPDELIMAAYFCWTDMNGAPSERGDHAFGLTGEHGQLRPAYNAALYQMRNAPVVDVPVSEWLAASRAPEASHEQPASPGGSNGGTPVETPPPPPQTLTEAQAHELRFRAITPSAVYNHDFGFERAWRKPENNWWGSPITEGEYTLEDGRPLRIFANAVVVYNPGEDTTEVLE